MLVLFQVPPNSECFKCGKAGHIHSVCNITVHFAKTNAKNCVCDPTELNVSSDHLSLSKTSRSGITSYSSSELSKTQNHCETKVSNQPTSYQIFHSIVPDLVCPSDSHISDEISYNSANNMLNESDHDQKPDLVLVDANISNDPLFSNETLNKFEGNISEKSDSDVISNAIRRHNGFISTDIPNECDEYVPDESNSSHISDVIVSDAGHSPNQCASRRVPSQLYGE
ncbi:uncharacterized protein Smp_204180 [Schistosoma mansoni]|uniref:uncharacterized protein n=1 Tax=Schistosoma mansoni TaxID=6183 RepID=UPI00022DCBD5|nr:uncharacterized protein Smp_204180 [Schistosoma mansoni]|eukprot:XP_018654700.1 uncharacterized protein Smp_204180 [Schistosoma mansoni]